MWILEHFYADIVGNRQDQLILLVLLSLGWIGLSVIVNNTYRSRRLKPKELADTKNRIVSIVHGMLSFAMTVYALIGSEFNQPNTSSQICICMFSLSYCIYDSVACWYYGLFSKGLVIHHLMCLIGFGSAIWLGYGAIDSLGGLFVAEASNMPMHVRVILRNYGFKYMKIYELFENVYIFLYILFRGIICPFYVLWPSLNSPNSPLIVQFICVGMTIQSYYYIIQMQRIIRRKIAQFKQMKKKKIKYRWFHEANDIEQLSFVQSKKEPRIF